MDLLSHDGNEVRSEASIGNPIELLMFIKILKSH
jgi:hypothetical protein